jgi:hypothetical protein
MSGSCDSLAQPHKRMRAAAALTRICAADE